MTKATITVNVPNPDITYPSAISTSSSQFSGVDKTYSFSKNYAYAAFTVTCGTKSKKFQIHIMD